MDFSDLGDFLYIILIIAFGIIGAIGKNKKKKALLGAGPAADRKPTFWEEIQRQMTGEQISGKVFDSGDVEDEEVNLSEPIEEEQPIISSPLERRKSYTFSEQRLKRESIEYQGLGNYGKQQSEPLESIKNDAIEEDDFKLDLGDIDEVKKGIIYAEILNKKYA